MAFYIIGLGSQKVSPGQGLTGCTKERMPVTFARWRGDSKIVEAIAEHDFCCQRLIGMFRAMEQASSPLCNRSDPAPEKLFGAWIYNEEWLRWHCLADRTKNIV